MSPKNISVSGFSHCGKSYRIEPPFVFDVREECGGFFGQFDDRLYSYGDTLEELREDIGENLCCVVSLYLEDKHIKDNEVTEGYKAEQRFYRQCITYVGSTSCDGNAITEEEIPREETRSYPEKEVEATGKGSHP